MNQNSLTVDLVAWIILAMAVPWYGKIIIVTWLWYLSSFHKKNEEKPKLAPRPRRIP